jgi:hypothetical protein
MTSLGPYDYWAIEYGYKDGDAAELKKIAARSGEPDLYYAPDEDCRAGDPDPLVNRFDLGANPVDFAKTRAELVAQLIPGLADRIIEPGEGYQRTLRAFDVLLRTQTNSVEFAARVIGGVYLHRAHKGDANGKPPAVVVEAAKQREAMDFLKEQVFGEKSYEFPPELYACLVPARWLHWGMREPARIDYPVRDVILLTQDRVLMQLLSPQTLSRIMDCELKVPADQDAFTAAEMFDGLSASIFRELDRLQQGEYTNRKPAVSALRRNLQRRYVERLANVALGNLPAPEDCVTLAHAQLDSLRARIVGVLGGKAKLDAYTQAHLKETAQRIGKVLDAKLEMRAP